MCKNENFQSSETKNELFKVQRRKMNILPSLETKKILLPIIYLFCY